MLKEERQQLILNELYKQGRVLVNDLSAKYYISKDTARRDLSDLESQGVLKRVFGGAIPTKLPVAAVETRMHINRSEKQVVAQKAAKLIKQDSLIAIDGGSTNLLLAESLPMGIRLRVVTNSFPVAAELRGRPHIDVIFLGGRYDKGSQTSVGETAVKQLMDYHFDQCFLGVHALDADIGASVPFPFEKEADIKKAIITRSNEVIAMCAVDKLDKHANYIICHLEQIDKIICDRTVNETQMRRYQYKII